MTATATAKAFVRDAAMLNGGGVEKNETVKLSLPHLTHTYTHTHTRNHSGGIQLHNCLSYACIHSDSYIPLVCFDLIAFISKQQGLLELLSLFRLYLFLSWGE